MPQVPRSPQSDLGISAPSRDNRGRLPSGSRPFLFIRAHSAVNIDQWTGDVRHNVSNADAVHGYYAFQRDLRGEPTLQLNSIPGFGDTRQSHRQIMTLNETHIFGSNLVNEARFGFNRINITFEPNAKLNPTDYGINDGVTSAIGIPQITVLGVGLNFGGPAGFPQGRTDTSFVFSDGANYLRGNHAIKFGGEFRRVMADNFTSDTGTFQFPSLAAFQAGLGNFFQITLGDRPSNVRQQAVGLFVQDSVRPSPNLSFDLGLRYEGIMGPTETEGRYVVFDAASASLVQANNPYHTGHNLQPRAGVIWNPSKDGRTVVRGAYAVMVDMPVVNVVTPTSANPPLAVPLTFTGNIRLDSAAATALASGLAPNSVDPNFQSGRMQTWNVNVEQQIGPALGVMAGYFGSHGDRLRITRNVNQFVDGVRPFPKLSQTSAILPGGALGNITETDSLGWSNYKGLRPANRVRRRLVRGGRGVRLARVGGRRLPLRESRPERDPGAGLQQHGFLGDQEPDAGGERAPAVPHRGVQHLQPGQPGAARTRGVRTCRRGGKHRVRRDQQHALPHWRLWLGAAGAVRD